MVKVRGITLAFSGAANGIAGNLTNCASRPPLERVVRLRFVPVSVVVPKTPVCLLVTTVACVVERIAPPQDQLIPEK